MILELLQSGREAYFNLLKIESRIKEFDEYRISRVNFSSVKISPTNNHKNEFDDMLIAKEAIYNEYLNLFRKKLKIDMEIEKYIDVLQDPIERFILRARYINCENWETIARKSEYSIRQVHRIEKEAIKKLAEKEIKKSAG